MANLIVCLPIDIYQNENRISSCLVVSTLIQALYLFVSFSLNTRVSLSICLLRCLSMSVFVSVSDHLSVTPSGSFSVPVFVFLSMSASVSLYVSVFLCLSLWSCISLCLHLSVSLCLCLSACMSLSLSDCLSIYPCLSAFRHKVVIYKSGVNHCDYEMLLSSYPWRNIMSSHLPCHLLLRRWP